MTLIKRIFGDKNTPQPRNAYAIEHGVYVGEFFVFIERVKDVFYFLSLPKMEFREVSKQDYTTGVRDKIIVFTEKIPHQVYKTCVAQYKKVKNEQKFNNGHAKSTVPDLSHQPA